MVKRPRKKAVEHIAHPHDSLFKWAFSQPHHAEGLLRMVLPKEVVAAVDMSTLKIENGSYVDAALRHLHSDLLMSARMFGSAVYFYALVEQQRDHDERMALRVGQYLMRIWSALARSKAKQLAPILPIVLYNGSARWTAPTAFQDLVVTPPGAGGTLLPYIPRFSFQLVDLRGEQLDWFLDSTLTALGQVVTWSLSVAGDDERFERESHRFGKALEAVMGAPDAVSALGALLRYLLATHPKMPPDKLKRVVEHAGGPRTQEAIVTYLEEIEQKGRQRGRAEVLLELLASRFWQLPPDTKERVLTAKEEELRQWTLRVLDASSLAEVLASNPSTPTDGHQKT